MKPYPKISPDPCPPRSGCPPQRTLAPVQPLDVVIAPVEIHSCARRMSGPTPLAVPAAPPAGSVDPARRVSTNSLPLRPAWRSPSSAPASACRSPRAVLSDASASSSSGSPVAPRRLSHRSRVPPCFPALALTPSSCSPVHISPPSAALSSLRFRILVPPQAVRPFRRSSQLHSPSPP
jgi:hypothetical protein